MSKKSTMKTKSTILLSSAAAIALTFGAMPAEAASKGGHSDGSTHVEGAGHDGGSGGAGGKRRGKSGDIIHRGSGGGSLRDVFRDMVDETDEQAMDHDDHDDSDHGGGKRLGKQPGGTAGKKGGSGGGHTEPTDTAEDEPEDSDRPEWAGVPGKDGKPGRPNTEPGTTKGDLFGDMYVLDRDENGVPILVEVADGVWVVQPIDADGNPIALDEEGHPLDPDAAIEVELGRLNVGRAPTRVLSVRYEEVLKNLNLADEISLDATGRITYTIDGETKTIDSPLENLALYVELMNTGTLDGIDDTSKFTGDLANLVDGTLTIADYTEAASFFAAASDKTGDIGIDQLVYMTQILSIDGTLPDDFVDYSAFTYDRSDAYSGVMVEVLVLQPDSTWKAETVDVYDAVFNETDYSSTSGVDGFAQAADDARAVIEFVHEYEVPVTALN